MYMLPPGNRGCHVHREGGLPAPDHPPFRMSTRGGTRARKTLKPATTALKPTEYQVLRRLIEMKSHVLPEKTPRCKQDLPQFLKQTQLLMEHQTWSGQHRAAPLRANSSGRARWKRARGPISRSNHLSCVPYRHAHNLPAIRAQSLALYASRDCALSRRDLCVVLTPIGASITPFCH